MIASILKVLGAVASAIGVLNQFGVNTGPIGNEVLRVVEDVPVNLTNFQDGQAVVVATFSEQGIPGTLVAVKNGGPAAASLGL